MATSTIAHEVTTRRVGRPRKDAAPLPGVLAFDGDLLMQFSPAIHAASGIRFPSSHYQADPVAFGREILGVDFWSRQIEILEAVRDHPRVAVRSGHKIGKSFAAAALALWYYCSYEFARVVMSSTTARQVDEILWREVRMTHARSGRCLDCKIAIEQARARGDRLDVPRPCPHSSLIDGDLGDTARTGFKSADFREIVGFTASQAEAVAGISGQNVLYIVDEASGVNEFVFEAIEGNRAGKAKLVLFSNPTQNQGTFYDAFNSKARFWKTITVSSEDTPNAIAGHTVIPGLAEREWIDEKREEWGEKSPLFIVRIKGQHAEYEEGKIFSVHEIAQSVARRSETPAEGRLYIGVDPAGEKGTGDEAAFCCRRGLKQLEFEVPRVGLTEDGHLTTLLVLIARHKLPRETPVVVVDRDGSIGSKVYNAFRSYAEHNPGSFEIVGVRGSDKSQRQPLVYHLMREALTASLSAWFLAGGAIVDDAKLEKELHVMEWRQRPDGRMKVTDKLTLRKVLGRSPDRYDALALSTWEPLSLREESAATDTLARAREQRTPYDRGPMDPYAGARAWERR